MLDALQEITAAELENAKALREVKGLLHSLTGEYLSPADDLATAEDLRRQLQSLAEERGRLFDAMAVAGCSLLRQAR